MLRANSDGAHKARGSNIARFERPKYFWHERDSRSPGCRPQIYRHRLGASFIIPAQANYSHKYYSYKSPQGFLRGFFCGGFLFCKRTFNKFWHNRELWRFYNRKKSCMANAEEVVCLMQKPQFSTSVFRQNWPPCCLKNFYTGNL